MNLTELKSVKTKRRRLKDSNVRLSRVRLQRKMEYSTQQAPFKRLILVALRALLDSGTQCLE